MEVKNCSGKIQEELTTGVRSRTQHSLVLLYHWVYPGAKLNRPVSSDDRDSLVLGANNSGSDEMSKEIRRFVGQTVNSTRAKPLAYTTC
mmetsp:Transcript_15878/g.24721  ORF Transcript_15878/g.24721 Transcript_15878/m.24721 type:complete len:89 (+) Transcript_15878:371-637(+)